MELNIDIDSGLYSDVTLFLKDASGASLELKLHRLILSYHIPYFATFFSFQEKSGGQLSRNVEIEVPDAVVSGKLLRSRYGEKNSWETGEFLKLQLCKSFFGLEISEEDFIFMQVSEKYFDLLLSVVSLPEVKWNEGVRRVVKRNLPKNYEWSEENEELKKEIEKNEFIFVRGGGGVEMFDMVNGKCEWELPINASQILPLTEQRIMTLSKKSSSILMWDVKGRKILKEYKPAGDEEKVEYLEMDVFEGKILAAIDKMTTLRIWNMETGAIVKTHVFKSPEKSLKAGVKISLSGEYIFIYSHDSGADTSRHFIYHLKSGKEEVRLFNLNTNDENECHIGYMEDPYWYSEDVLIYASSTEVALYNVISKKYSTVFLYCYNCDCGFKSDDPDSDDDSYFDCCNHDPYIDCNNDMLSSLVFHPEEKKFFLISSKDILEEYDKDKKRIFRTTSFSQYSSGSFYREKRLLHLTKDGRYFYLNVGNYILGADMKYHEIVFSKKVEVKNKIRPQVLAILM